MVLFGHRQRMVHRLYAFLTAAYSRLHTYPTLYPARLPTIASTLPLAFCSRTVRCDLTFRAFNLHTVTPLLPVCYPTYTVCTLTFTPHDSRASTFIYTHLPQFCSTVPCAYYRYAVCVVSVDRFTFTA